MPNARNQEQNDAAENLVAVVHDVMRMIPRLRRHLDFMSVFSWDDDMLCDTLCIAHWNLPLLHPARLRENGPLGI